MFQFKEESSIHKFLSHVRDNINQIKSYEKRNQLMMWLTDRKKTMDDIKERMESLNKAMDVLVDEINNCNDCCPVYKAPENISDDSKGPPIPVEPSIPDGKLHISTCGNIGFGSPSPSATLLIGNDGDAVDFNTTVGNFTTFTHAGEPSHYNTSYYDTCNTSYYDTLSSNTFVVSDDTNKNPNEMFASSNIPVNEPNIVWGNNTTCAGKCAPTETTNTMGNSNYAFKVETPMYGRFAVDSGGEFITTSSADKCVPNEDFNRKDLVSFGNYVLSDERTAKFSDTFKDMVHHADIENWKLSPKL